MHSVTDLFFGPCRLMRSIESPFFLMHVQIVTAISGFILVAGNSNKDLRVERVGE